MKSELINILPPPFFCFVVFAENGGEKGHFDPLKTTQSFFEAQSETNFAGYHRKKIYFGSGSLTTIQKMFIFLLPAGVLKEN